MNEKITYRARILLTHPFETCKILEISQGRAPECANSTIFCRVFISDIYKITFFFFMYPQYYGKESTFGIKIIELSDDESLRNSVKRNKFEKT